jgi:hypothetical protein
MSSVNNLEIVDIDQKENVVENTLSMFLLGSKIRDVV